MVEILVVIGVIIVLLGIGAVAGSRFIAEGKKTQVRSMLDGLIGANDSFSAERQQGHVNHDGKTPMDWTKGNASRYSSSERFVLGCESIEVVERKMITAMNSGGKKQFERVFADEDRDGTVELYDLWGTQLEYRAQNFDGTGRGPGTNVSNNLLPRSRTPFFVSAGPDKKFGPQADGSNDDITTIDNPIYE